MVTAGVRPTPRKYEPGEQVFYFRDADGKLSARWKGPATVVGCTDERQTQYLLEYAGVSVRVGGMSLKGVGEFQVGQNIPVFAAERPADPLADEAGERSGDELGGPAGEDSEIPTQHPEVFDLATPTKRDEPEADREAAGGSLADELRKAGTPDSTRKRRSPRRMREFGELAPRRSVSDERDEAAEPTVPERPTERNVEPVDPDDDPLEAFDDADIENADPALEMPANPVGITGPLRRGQKIAVKWPSFPAGAKPSVKFVDTICMSFVLRCEICDGPKTQNNTTSDLI